MQIQDGAMLSVCFERGGKLSSSPDRMFAAGTMEKLLHINEPLNLVATLYKDTKSGIIAPAVGRTYREYSRIIVGTFQSKKGKVMLRELSKNKFGGSSYVGLDMAEIYLNEFVSDEKNSFEVVLQLPKVDGAVRITISSQIIDPSGADDVDDTMSVLSANSDMSELGATFDDRQANQYNGKRSSVRGSLLQETIHEEVEDTLEADAIEQADRKPEVSNPVSAQLPMTADE